MTKQQLKKLDEDQLNAEREQVLAAGLQAGLNMQKNVETAYKRQLVNVDAEFKERNLQPKEVIEDDIPF